MSSRIRTGQTGMGEAPGIRAPHISQVDVRHDINQLTDRSHNIRSRSFVLESDKLNPDCIDIAAYLSHQIVGCLRLNLGNRSRIRHLLPQQNILSPEVSRLVVCHSIGADQRVFQALLIEAGKLASEYHHEHLVTLLSIPMYELFVRQGYPLETLYDQPIFDEGRLNYPVIWCSLQLMEFCRDLSLPDLTLKRLFPED